MSILSRVNSFFKIRFYKIVRVNHFNWKVFNYLGKQIDHFKNGFNFDLALQYFIKGPRYSIFGFLTNFDSLHQFNNSFSTNNGSYI